MEGLALWRTSGEGVTTLIYGGASYFFLGGGGILAWLGEFTFLVRAGLFGVSRIILGMLDSCWMVTCFFCSGYFRWLVWALSMSVVVMGRMGLAVAKLKGRETGGFWRLCRH